MAEYGVMFTPDELAVLESLTDERLEFFTRYVPTRADKLPDVRSIRKKVKKAIEHYQIDRRHFSPVEAKAKTIRSPKKP